MWKIKHLYYNSSLTLNIKTKKMFAFYEISREVLSIYY